MSRKRNRARQAAVQGLYQWQVGGQDLSDIERQFKSEQDMTEVEVPYFTELLHGVPANCNALDDALTPFLDRPIERVDPVERAILRLGAYELMFRLEVPFRVVINEAVELAKIFGAEQSHRYVNGVLDKVARKVRRAETAG